VNSAFRFLIFPLVLLIGACVFPTRLADEKPFGREATGFIDPGNTPKAEIEAKLGSEFQESADARWWVFHADRRMSEWFWFICVGGGSLGAPVGCDGGDFGGKHHRYSLVIQFDELDIVKNTAVVSEKNPCTDDMTLCYRDGVLTVNISNIPGRRPEKSPILLRPHIADPWDRSGIRATVMANTEYQTELVDRSGLIYEVGSTVPFTGHVTLSDDQGIKEWGRTYEDGKLNGVETFWYRNGEVSYQAHYVDNLHHGPMTFWERDGSVSSRLCYEYGLLVDVSMDECHP